MYTVKNIEAVSKVHYFQNLEEQQGYNAVVFGILSD